MANKMPAQDKTRVPGFVVPSVLAILWALLCVRVLHGWPLNADEGFYLAASRALGDGMLPYRDYAYTQMPLLPIIQAPFFAVLPASLAGIRMLGILWTSLFLAAAWALLSARLGALRALGCFGLMFLCVDTLGLLSIGKTYPLAQLLFLLAALPLFMPLSWRARLLLVSAAGVLCVGVRLTMAPSILALWAGLWALHRGEARWTWMLGVPGVFALLAIGPFVAMDPARFMFFNLAFHLDSLLPAHPGGFWRLALGYLPGPWMFFTIALVANGRRLSAFSVLLAASVLGVVANLATVGVYMEYVTPFILPGLVGAAGVLAQGSPRRWEIAAYAACAAAGIALLSPPRSTSCENDASAAARFLAAHSAAGDPVLASMPEIPVEARRPVFRNLLMGKFTVTGDIPAGPASRLGFIHITDLVGAVERREAAAVVLSSAPTGNFYYSLPSQRVFTGIRRELLGKLLAGYYVAFSNRSYVILLRRDHQLANAASPLPGL
jgi:hypothetical protein